MISPATAAPAQSITSTYDNLIEAIFGKYSQTSNPLLWEADKLWPSAGDPLFKMLIRSVESKTFPPSPPHCLRRNFWSRNRELKLFIYNLFTKSTGKYISDTRFQERNQEKHIVI
jgi:hypothetical protein